MGNRQSRPYCYLDSNNIFAAFQGFSNHLPTAIKIKNSLDLSEIACWIRYGTLDSAVVSWAEYPEPSIERVSIADIRLPQILVYKVISLS